MAPARGLARSRRVHDARSPLWWARWSACRGRTSVFFPPHAERPEARQLREERARALCRRCPVLVACREWARTEGEYGFWGGESEEERAAAGFPVELPTGRVARILRDRRTMERLGLTNLAPIPNGPDGNQYKAGSSLRA